MVHTVFQYKIVNISIIIIQHQTQKDVIEILEDIKSNSHVPNI
jgi:hypothetical protein